MPWSDGGWYWLALGLGLFVLTFGSFAFLTFIYIICIFGGGLLIAYYHGREKSRATLINKDMELCKSRSGIKQIMSRMEKRTKFKNFDKRMTGASVIDEVLQEVMEFAIKDYIKSWYRQISDHDGFLLDIRQCAQKVAITFAMRSKEVDWMPYFTQRLVDDFASHIRLYRRAVDKIQISSRDESYEDEIQRLFFDFEVNMEGTMCRDLVSLSPEDERQYLRDLSEALLFLLLPREDFHNKLYRFMVREVLVNGIFLPTIDLVSDPDYINQYLSWLCKETTFTSETFLTVIKSSDSIEELEAVKEMVDSDIARWRSKDTGGTGDTLVKQNLNSLLFVKSICEGRIKRIKSGVNDPDFGQDIPDFCKAKNLFVLSLDDIIENNIALSVFIEFMTSVGGHPYLFFYLNVEGFRAAAEQQISAARQRAMGGIAMEADLESLRRAAMIIYDQYLSDKASSKIKLESDIVKRTLQKIKSKMLSEDLFDEVQARVYQIMHSEQYYENFLQSNVYLKMLEEMGLVHETKSDDGDTTSIDDDISTRSTSSSFGNDEGMDLLEEKLLPRSRSNSSLTGSFSDGLISAYISQTGIVKETDKTGKSYAVFAIRVTRKVNDEEEVLEVYRRYSDFHDLNMLIQEKFPDIQGPHLPPKTVLKNTNREFLEKRRKALDNYLQALMQPDIWQQYPGLMELVLKFLAPGLWEKHKSELARKMDTIVNPLRTSVKTVGRAMSHSSDGFTENIGKVFGNDSLEDNKKTEDGKVGAALGVEIVDNIPLKIMLLLMDELFDLRLKNQWFRRRMTVILRQLIKTTFGDTINRKIVDYVDWMTSAEQMAEYVKKFRDSYWPNGILAEPRSTRDLNTKMRTRVACKAKMLGSVTDELRTLLGTESIKHGVGLLFLMFQHKNLNKRFVYVFLEGVIQTLYPQNKFPELFCKLHSKSQRLKTKDVPEKKDIQNPNETTVRKRQVKR